MMLDKGRDTRCDDAHAVGIHNTSPPIMTGWGRIPGWHQGNSAPTSAHSHEAGFHQD